VNKRKDREALQRLAVVAAAAVEAEELLRMETDVPADVRAEADRRIKVFHLVWNESKR
jgi:hypothetical protein